MLTYVKARTARFYGWTNEHIDNLPLPVFHEYAKAIDVLASEEQLVSLEAQFAPHLKDAGRKDLVRKHKAKIRSGVDRTQGKLATVESLAKAFARMQMNGR